MEEISKLYETLRSVVKHFYFSGKSKEILDNAMAILELQPMKLVSWCGTRMCHFLDACHTVSGKSPAVHDAMFSRDIKVANN